MRCSSRHLSPKKNINLFSKVALIICGFGSGKKSPDIFFLGFFSSSRPDAWLGYVGFGSGQSNFLV